jgi:murein DD-endopeptidase MepM/ murein hydrolase activator NlpD
MIRKAIRGARLATIDGVLFLLLLGFALGRPAGGAASLAGTPWAAEIRAAANAHGLDPALLAAVVQQESGGDPAAVSVDGAQGLAQLMPATAALYGVADPFDPTQNLDGAAAYLADLLARYDDNIPLALAAYNAGPKRVDGCQCIPDFAETRRFVANVTRFYDAYRRGDGAAGGFVDRLYGGRRWRVTNGRLHGLSGWEGVDVKAGCGAPLYNPLGVAATVTRSGSDGYIGPYSYEYDGEEKKWRGEQNTMITLTAGNVEMTLLHGLYLPQVGDVVQPDQLIGYEAEVGNATGCHNHLILRRGGATINALGR